MLGSLSCSRLWRQRHALPALGAEAKVALGELPDHDLGAREELRAAKKFLADEGRSAAIVDDAGERTAQCPRDVGDESGTARLVLLVDAEKTVAEREHFRCGVVGVGRCGVAMNDLRAGGELRLNALLKLRRTRHPRNVAETRQSHGPTVIAHLAACQPA